MFKMFVTVDKHQTTSIRLFFFRLYTEFFEITEKN